MTKRSKNIQEIKTNDRLFYINNTIYVYYIDYILLVMTSDEFEEYMDKVHWVYRMKKKVENYNVERMNKKIVKLYMVMLKSNDFEHNSKTMKI